MMERTKNLIVLMLEILVILAIILFIAVYIAANSTEKTYQNVLSDIKSGNFKEAETEIKTIPHYKDSNDISLYIYPISLFYNKYDTKDNEIKGYRMSLKSINEMVPKLKNISYKKDLTELSKVLNFKISEIQAESKNEGQEKQWTDVADRIKLGDVAGATEKLSKFTKPSDQYTKNELLAYINFTNAENLNDDKAIMESMKQLDPNYNGILSDTIQTSVLKYVDSIKWNESYKGEGVVKIDSIKLGMGKAELTGILGPQLKSNRISNKYGHFEIVYYKDGKTLYLENSKLIAYTENNE
jgi:hypothetical protein